jgi:transposase-like protein
LITIYLGGNRYSKEEKRAIGKEAYDKVDTLANLARKYSVPYQSVLNWRKAYAKSIGEVSLKSASSKRYEEMNEAELRTELLKGLFENSLNKMSKMDSPFSIVINIVNEQS